MPRKETGNLPAETRKLIGRQPELEQIRRLLDTSRLVTLTGVGGVGKTRLALRAATLAQGQLHDGAWWVDLSALRRGLLLASDIVEAMRLADQSQRPMLDVLADHLADCQLLLVLDTCEHLVDDCASVAEALLAAAPGLRILATSRRPLGLAAEHIVTVAPLDIPEDGDRAADSAAVALLTARAAEAAPGFAVTDANRPDLVRLCRRLDGLPLAIELAAARLSELSPAELTDRLEDRFAVLGTTDAVVDEADPPWHQALRTAIGWSHELCAPAERLLWARLSVFAGGFDAEAARQVCADAHLPRQSVPELLATLVDKSIVTWEPTGDGERYRMLDTLREFGAGWLRGLGEEPALRHRHREYFADLAHEADAAWLGPQQIDWYRRTVAEHANLRAALDHYLAEQDGPGALDLSAVLGYFWYACGYVREGRHYLEQALAMDAPGAPARANALWVCGLIALTMGDHEASARLVGAFREAVAEETDETLLAAALVESAAMILTGRTVRAGEILDAAPRTGPSGGRYDAAWFLLRVCRSMYHVQLGQFTEGVAAADELCAEAARRGETWARSWGDYVRAVATLGLGRTAEAAAHARASLGGKHRIHDRKGTALNLEVIAAASVADGRAEEAARFLGTAEQIWDTLGVHQAGIPELVAARAACEEHTRAALGDDAYKAAFHTGYTTDLDTGIAQALSPPRQDGTQRPAAR